MTLLAPLGLLGLLGVVALIIIYIIRPNFQQKFISSTYVWKLSLKYRKKKIPTSKLRNILLILCQVLFLTTCAVVLAQPNKVLRSFIQEPEVIVIVDSSASMRAGTAVLTDTGKKIESRYTRAVYEAYDLAEDTFDKGGFVTVIMANESPDYLLKKRVSAEERSTLETELENLITGDTQCSYASSDVDGAIGLCEEIIKENPAAKIYLYTDTVYASVPKSVKLVNVTEEEEWNGAILNAEAKREESRYTFYVDVACYGGVNTLLNVSLDINGANAANASQGGQELHFELDVLCMEGETVQLLFINEEFYDENPEIYDMIYGENIYKIASKEKVGSYKSIEVSLKDQTGAPLEDSYEDDNTFFVYGGMREVINIQYASAMPNSFWPAAVRQLRNVVADKWDIEYTEVKKDIEPALSGFDLYIFEHTMPERLPEDGVVWLVTPDQVPTSTGIRIGQPLQTNNPLGEPLQAVAQHPIINNVDAADITVSMFAMLILDESYEPLLALEEIPILAVRDDSDVKIVVSAFNMHYSNLAITLEFPLLVYNVFNYFFPSTVERNAFAVNEKVTLNCMSEKLNVISRGYDQTFSEFPSELVVSKPGTYTLRQTTFAGRDIREQIYVRTPIQESNIFAQGGALAEPYQINEKEEFFEDLLFYLAIGLTVVAFVEWWLRGQQGA